MVSIGTFFSTYRIERKESSVFFEEVCIYQLKRRSMLLSRLVNIHITYIYIHNKIISDNRSWPMYRASASHDTDHIFLF